MAERFADGLAATKSECRDAENALANAAHVNGPRELVNNSAIALLQVYREKLRGIMHRWLTHPAYPFRGPKYERFCRERDALIAKESNGISISCATFSPATRSAP